MLQNVVVCCPEEEDQKKEAARKLGIEFWKRSQESIFFPLCAIITPTSDSHMFNGWLMILCHEREDVIRVIVSYGRLILEASL